MTLRLSAAAASSSSSSGSVGPRLIRSGCTLRLRQTTTTDGGGCRASFCVSAGEASASLGIRCVPFLLLATSRVHQNSVGRPAEGVTLSFFGTAARHIINFCCCFPRSFRPRGRWRQMHNRGGGGGGKIRDEEEAARATINLTISGGGLQTRSHIHHPGVSVIYSSREHREGC